MSRRRHANRTTPMLRAVQNVCSFDNLPLIGASGTPAVTMVYVAGGDFSGETVGVASTSHGLSINRTKSLNARTTTHDLQNGTVVFDIADDVIRIAATALGTRGVLVEPARANLITNGARNINGGSFAATAITRTSDAVNGPDGSLSADRAANTSTLGNARATVVVTAGYRVAFSLWARSPSGSKQTQFGVNRSTDAYVVANLLDTKWQRFSILHTGTTGTSVLCYANDARNKSAAGGLTAAMRDDYVDFMQCEEGTYPTSCVFTNGTSESRNSDRLSAPTSSVMSVAGRIKFYAKFEAPAALADIPEPSAGSTLLYFWNAGTSFGVWVDASTGTVYARGYSAADGFHTNVNTTTALSFAAGDIVEFWAVIGADEESIIKWRINGGAVVSPSLSSVKMFSVPDPSGANPNRPQVTTEILNYSSAYLMPGVFSEVGFVSDSSTPSGF